MKRNRPERGSQRAGTHWFYNNWDFNVIAHLIAPKLAPHRHFTNERSRTQFAMIE